MINKDDEISIPNEIQIDVFEIFENEKMRKRINDHEYHMSLTDKQCTQLLSERGIDGDAAVKRIQERLYKLKKDRDSEIFQEKLKSITSLLNGLVKDLFQSLQPANVYTPNLAMRSNNSNMESSDTNPSALPFMLTKIGRNLKGNWRIRLDFQNPRTEAIQFEIRLNGQNVDSQQSMDDDGKVCTIEFAAEDNLEEKYLEIFSNANEVQNFIFNFTKFNEE